VDDDQADFLQLPKEWKYYRLRKQEKNEEYKGSERSASRVVLSSLRSRFMDLGVSKTDAVKNMQSKLGLSFVVAELA